MKKLYFIILMLLFVFSCGKDTESTESPCKNVDCSGHGVCDDSTGHAVCDCDDGYTVDNLENCISNPCLGITCDSWEYCSGGDCKVLTNRCNTTADCLNNSVCNTQTHICEGGETNPCEGITCSNHGTCKSDGYGYNANKYCVCDSGYKADDLNCIPDSTDPCENVTCNEWESCDNGDCVLNENRCNTNEDCLNGDVCNQSNHNCISNPCDGVTCSNLGICSAVNGEAQCFCNHGYKSSDLTCVSDSSVPGWCGIKWVGTDNSDIYGMVSSSANIHVYGQIWIDGVTGSTKPQASNVKAQLGIIPIGDEAIPQTISYPVVSANYRWIDATFNTSCTNCGNNHEYIGNFPFDVDGNFLFIYRFSTNNGTSWSYCDKTPGFITSSVNLPGKATVVPSDDGGPKVQLVSQPVTTSNSYSFSVKYIPGIEGDDIDLSSSIIYLNGVQTNLSSSYNSTTKTFTISGSNLTTGKYTYLFKIKDTAGNKAKYLYVPMWIEATQFTWKDGFMYQIMNDRFVDGDSSNNGSRLDNVDIKADWQGGDFNGIIQKIDSNYFTNMGVNTLWISSPVRNTQGKGKGMGDDPHYYSGYHSYWPVAIGWTADNHLTGMSSFIEPHFGTEAELRELIQKAHKKGIRILVDFVANHVHTDSPLWTQYKNAGWFNFAPSGKPQNSNGGYNCGWDEPIVCWFTDYLPDLNYSNQQALKTVIDHAIWLIQEYDIDGFRLDAIKHMVMGFTTTLRERIQNEVVTTGIPFYMVGETFTGAEEYDTIGMFLGSDKLDGQFDFPMFYNISWTFLLRTKSMSDFKGFAEYNDTRYQNGYWSGAIMSTFMGNHDIARVISVANGDFDGSPQGGDIAHQKAWENSPVDPTNDSPYAKLRMAQTFLLTSPGLPLIYQGDEFGLAGAHDPDNRRMMKFESQLNSYQTATLNHVKKLGTFRNKHESIRKGTRTTCSVGTDFWVYKMTYGNDVVIVGLNRSNAEVESTCTGITGTYEDAFSSQQNSTFNGTIYVPANGFAVLGKVN